MSRVTVRPSREDFYLKDMVEGEWDARDLLALLAVRSIEVDDEAWAWIVALDAPDRSAWSRATRSVTKDQFEMLLAAVKQEIRKRVDGLEQIRWAFPKDLDRDRKSVV